MGLRNLKRILNQFTQLIVLITCLALYYNKQLWPLGQSWKFGAMAARIKTQFGAIDARIKTQVWTMETIDRRRSMRTFSTCFERPRPKRWKWGDRARTSQSFEFGVATSPLLEDASLVEVEGQRDWVWALRRGEEGQQGKQLFKSHKPPSDPLIAASRLYSRNLGSIL